MLHTTRRGALALGAATLAAPSIAQGPAPGRFPERPIRLVIPWVAGSSSDAQLRSLCELAGRALGQPVIPENRPGAGGTLGPAGVAQQARPDGYTLTQMHLSVMRRPWMMKTPQWDPVADFTHIIGLTGWTFGTAVKADHRFADWRGMIAFARKNPGAVSYATSGIGTTNHLAMEQISELEKIEFIHVPFRGSAEGVTAVLSGQVDMICDSSTWGTHVDAGSMRALALWSAEPIPRYAGVPTWRQLGYDIVVASPYGISGPKGMDPGVVRVLHDAFKAALHDPENARVRAIYDMPLVYHDSEAYAAFVVQRTAFERAMVQRLGLTLDG